ncbi:AHH domain-containing protein [Novosphingobium sp. MMS21-SN21R]|uniref:AHH domain-containing protein n=1 Tax=Novosphingobium sp. MMS21-SN21R TaxID=2969298 RepID=UPI002888F0B7|nr:AHH domain-containing protein [Novosphingobium sp. MMS21-SN21R]MDT0507809.1 AHH domain-containing protein [Novosphingobium sp. MMS21-SN21R]
MPLNQRHDLDKRATLRFGSVNVPHQPGYAPGLQRHHLIPRQILGSFALGRMIARLGLDRLGFHDFRRNGLLLPASEVAAMRIGLPLHRGPHRSYNELVMQRAGQIEAQWTLGRSTGAAHADYEALMRFDLLQRALRRKLLDSRSWTRKPLNARDPALDYTHLDNMADLLWSATDWTSQAA